MLFLSLGSNYTLRRAIGHLFTFGRSKDSHRLSTELCHRYQAEQAVLYARGRAALSEAVRLATGGKGGVAVTSLTCYVVIEAIKTAGCEPVYIDVDKTTLHFNANQLRRTLEKQSVQAVIIQNTLGIPVEINGIVAAARQYKVPIIEDLAHAVGGQYADGRAMGTVGDYAMLSFGRDKLLDTVNGGALLIRTKNHAAVAVPVEYVSTVQQLRDRIYPIIAWSARRLFPIGLGKYVIAAAYKLRLAVRSADGGTMVGAALPHWQARLAYKQLDTLALDIANRLQNQALYHRYIAHPLLPASTTAIRLPMLVSNRDKVVQEMKRQGVFAEDVWYEVPISPERLYDTVHFPEKDCPIATTLSYHIINLPTHQAVRQDDIKKIAHIINEKAQPWK